MSAQSVLSSVLVQGRKLEVQRIPAAAGSDGPTLVFLHEGLGSISMWRDFPAQAAAATGCPVVVYSRYGYGQSDVLNEPRGTSFMHDEAQKALPELLDRLDIHEPVLVGHSDGGSIALIHAATALGARGVKGVVAMAPHVFVEDLTLEGIVAAKQGFETTDLPQRLAKHHRDPARTFYGWNDIWLRPDFRDWNIEDYLPRITCPVLVVQGFDDEYGSMAQLDAIAKQAGGPVELLRLAACGHSPHRDQPRAVLEALAGFLSRLEDGA